MNTYGVFSERNIRWTDQQWLKTHKESRRLPGSCQRPWRNETPREQRAHQSVHERPFDQIGDTDRVDSPTRDRVTQLATTQHPAHPSLAPLKQPRHLANRQSYAGVIVHSTHYRAGVARFHG